MKTLGDRYAAIVLGAGGGIGSAIAAALEGDPACAKVLRYARSGSETFDVTREDSIAAAAAHARAEIGEAALIVNAVGVLDRHGHRPEKSLADIDPAAMAQAFAINTIGAALVFKHFHALLPRNERSVLATLSARVGSIGDNRLGGWFSYRASKAALNQIVRTSAIEIARKRKDAICVALHPGTVATPLSAPYAGERAMLTASQSAQKMLAVLDELDKFQTGGFFAWDGSIIEW